MIKKIAIILLGILLMSCSLNSFKAEVINLYQESGVYFSLKVRPKEGFLYYVGPYIDFNVENGAHSINEFYLIKAIVNINNELSDFVRGDYYTKGKLIDSYRERPTIIEKDSLWIGTTGLPDVGKFSPGKIPGTIKIDYKIDGIEKTITVNFEITIKGFPG